MSDDTIFSLCELDMGGKEKSAWVFPALLLLLNFYLEIKPVALLEMKTRYFRVFLGSWTGEAVFVGAGRGGGDGWMGRCGLLCFWLESFCLFV